MTLLMTRIRWNILHIYTYGIMSNGVLLQLTRTTAKSSRLFWCLFHFPHLNLSENTSRPFGEVGFVISDSSVLEDRHTSPVIRWIGASLAVGVAPCSLVPHAGPASDPVADVLPYAGEFEPAFGEELHHAAVSVHQEHVGQLCSVWGYQNVRRTHQLDLVSSTFIIRIIYFMYIYNNLVCNIACHASFLTLNLKTFNN